MKGLLQLTVFATLALANATALAGQAPLSADAPNVPISPRDRVYAAEQFSNTVSVIDPADNSLLGVIRLGDPTPANLSPLYRGQLLVHGLGYSPDRTTLAVVSIGSNSVSFIDTRTNTVRRTVYLGRSPHEAFYTPDGKEIWITIRGEDYVAVLDATTFQEKERIVVGNGPGMQIFSPDGRFGYVCSSFTPEASVVSVADHRVIAKVRQESAFCPDIAATPDGEQVWFTLKDIGRVQVFNARPPFNPIRTLETGPLTNHVNFASNRRGTFAYVTVGARNEVQVFRTDTFEQVAVVPVGDLPHGLWPSGDGSRIYVGLENADELAVIDTLTNRVIAHVAIGQAPQAVVYVPNAVPTGDGRQGLQELAGASQAVHLTLAPIGASGATPSTTVALFDQGVIQVLQAGVAGLEPKRRYVLALAERADGEGPLEPLATFMTNPAGAAVVNTIGPIRQVVHGGAVAPNRFLVIAATDNGRHGKPVQVQVK